MRQPAREWALAPLLVAASLATILFVAPTTGVLFKSETFEGGDLEALCKNKTTSLSRLSHIDKLLVKIDDDYGGECLDNTEAAIRDLRTLIDEIKTKECTMESFEKFKTFYARYLDTSDKKRRESHVNLPISLKHFALAFGIQLSGLCRNNMVKVLVEDVPEVIKPDDFEELGELVSKEGPIAAALGYTGKRPDEMILPQDFMLLLSNKSEKAEPNGNDDEKLSLKTQTTAYLRHIKTLCERRFRPIYAPLMLPVARFANLGFDNRKSVLKDTIRTSMKSDDSRDDIGRWTRVVFLCEIMNSLELVESEEDRKLAEGNDVQRVRVQTNYNGGARGDETGDNDSKQLQKSSQIEQANGNNGQQCVLSQCRQSSYRSDDMDYVVFKPNLSIDFPDNIYGSFSAKMNVAKFNTNMNEAENIRMRFATKTLRKFKSHLMHYRLFTFFKEFSKLVKQASEAKKEMQMNRGDVSKNFVQSLNNLIDQRLNPDSAVACGQCSQDPSDPRVVWAMIGIIVCGLIVFALVQMHSPIIG